MVYRRCFFVYGNYTTQLNCNDGWFRVQRVREKNKQTQVAEGGRFEALGSQGNVLLSFYYFFCSAIPDVMQSLWNHNIAIPMTVATPKDIVVSTRAAPNRLSSGAFSTEISSDVGAIQNASCVYGW